MRRVAVFGNAGGGKSTLARKLAALTKLPLYPLDMIQFRTGVNTGPVVSGDPTTGTSFAS